MRKEVTYIILQVALLLWGSAILLISCSGSGHASEEDDFSDMMTQQSDTLTIISSDNGHKSYKFQAPLMERYEFARDPYMEFRRGIEIETYDSIGNIESTLIADYAINYENRKLWEASGNVVATNAKGQILETQQLFWNQNTGKIYSNVDSKITQGDDILYVENFESDEDFQEWEFKRARGKMWVNVEPNENAGQGEQGDERSEENVPGENTSASATPVAPTPVREPAQQRQIEPRQSEMNMPARPSTASPGEMVRRSEEDLKMEFE